MRWLSILAEAMKLTSVIFFIILGALAFGHWITSAGIADALVQFVVEYDLKPWQFLLLINVIMLGLGIVSGSHRGYFNRRAAGAALAERFRH